MERVGVFEIPLKDIYETLYLTKSNIEDIDIAKEMMEKVKQGMLLQTNIVLMQAMNQQHRTYIVQLLQ